ncbi:hypothetical protein MMC17_009378 [Xylographa soralifera]|nr:hypothetical protein [Xylographa soralifera]
MAAPPPLNLINYAYFLPFPKLTACNVNSKFTSEKDTDFKRKRDEVQTKDNHPNTSKPTAIFEPGQGRAYTLSIALPGSIIANAQSQDLKATLAGQIARALAVFCVDEVVIFDDGQGKPLNHHSHGQSHQQNSQGDSGYSGYSNPNYFLTHLLSYLETPPHLRMHLFPLHPDLRTAGTLPSLDMPHHLRAHEWCQYRDGVTIEDPDRNGNEVVEEQGKKKKKRKSGGNGEVKISLVNAGLKTPVSISASIPPHTRVTLKFPASTPPKDFQTAELTAEAVAPSAPREEAGYYWGYAARAASSLSNVFTECTYDGGYDLTFGTSERGVPLSSLTAATSKDSSLPEFKHMLVVFGGVAGLEVAVKADPELIGMGVTQPEKLFDHWVNICQGQGSRTIRTEEAVWLGLMGLRDLVLDRGIKS